MGLKSARRGLRAAFRRHVYSFFSSLGALMANRVGTLMTVLVLGIAILLPLGLHITLLNLDRMDLGEAEWGALTVFLEPGTDATAASALRDAVLDDPAVETATLVSPEAGLAEFREASGFGESLDLLVDNPLPWVLTVTPGVAEPEALEGEVARLGAWLTERPSVASVTVDQQWLQRLARLLALGHSAVGVLVALFSLAVVVVVSNTIRLDVATRADEIEVLSLVGANDGFIRQPFLYSGFWYGLLGGLVALVLANLALVFLDVPFQRLLNTYGQSVHLLGPGLKQLGVLLLGSGVLGWLGAFIAVQRHLRRLRDSGTLGRR